MNTLHELKENGMPYAMSGGVRLSYRLEGPEQAPVLVLSNPVATSRWVWEPQASFFRRHFRVLTYDTRGHGASDAPAGEYTVDELGRDVLALLDHLGVERACFCGLSLGGMTGMWLAAHHPERIAKLVLSSCLPQVGNAPMWNARIEAVLRNGMADIAQSQVSRWFREDFAIRQPDVYQAFVEGIRQTSALGYAGCCAVLRDADLSAELPRISRPTLVLAGDADVVTPADKVKAVADAIPQAQFAVLPGGHLLNRDAGIQFDETVEGFLLA